MAVKFSSQLRGCLLAAVKIALSYEPQWQDHPSSELLFKEKAEYYLTPESSALLSDRRIVLSSCELEQYMPRAFQQLRSNLHIELGEIELQEGSPLQEHIPLGPGSRLYLKELQKKEVDAMVSQLSSLFFHSIEFPGSFLEYPFGLYKFSLESTDKPRFFGLFDLNIPRESVLARYELSDELNIKQAFEHKVAGGEPDLSRFLRKEGKLWLRDGMTVREQIFKDMCFLKRINSFGYALSVTILDADHFCCMQGLTLPQALDRGLLESTENEQAHRCLVPGTGSTRKLYLLRLVHIYRVSRKSAKAESVLNAFRSNSQPRYRYSFEYLQRFTEQVLDCIF